MRRSLYLLVFAVLFLTGIALIGSGCRKKVTPPPAVAKPEPPPPPPPAPAPTMSLSASPAAIEKGQSATLSWNSQNATDVTISGGVGSVEASGSRTVSPVESTTYTARATGAGGSATAEARITVTAPPPPPVAPPAPPVSDSVWFPQNVKDAYFDYDKYDIRPDAQGALQADSRALAERGQIRFVIEGHCDDRGSEKYNLALGDRRANAAKEYLVKQGVSADRMDTMSYGKERPVCSEQTEDCWQQNRRAHLVMK